MYKPHTVEQFKILRSLKEQGFVMERFILSPLSRTALLAEDSAGEKLAFSFDGKGAMEMPIPEPADKKEALAFIRRFRQDPNRPALRGFAEITAWWHATPNPLSYQQALGLPDDLYRHFLTHAVYDEEAVRLLVANGKVTEEELLGLRLWYHDGNAQWCWLGPLGIDGTGEIYGLTFHYRQPNASEWRFYLMDEYYRFMDNTK